jgi:hypothetical protein
MSRILDSLSPGVGGDVVDDVPWPVALCDRQGSHIGSATQVMLRLLLS